jgi:CBS domain-containing protein
MSLDRICKAGVVTTTPDTVVFAVAQMMSAQHVGSVIVVEEHRPIGIITDRDIVTKVVAAGRDPKTVPVKEVMATNPSLININYDPLDVTKIMRARGLRRLPVVDEHRHLLGIVTMDDVDDARLDM